MRPLIAAIAFLVASCDGSPTADPNVVYGRALLGLSSADENTRWDAASEMASMCCEQNSEVGARACERISDLLVAQPDWSNTRKLVFTRGVLDCMGERRERVIPALCRSGCTPKERSFVLFEFGALDPSPELDTAILDHLFWATDPTAPGAIAETSERDRDMRTPQEQLRADVVSVIRNLGEDDLEPLLAALRHADPLTKRVAFEAIEEAIDRGPLESPFILDTLETAANGPDLVLAATANRVAAAYRNQPRENPDQVVERWLRRDGTLHVRLIRMLWVRRFSCRASTADRVLRTLLDEPSDVDDAARALAFRARRCRGHDLAPVLRTDVPAEEPPRSTMW